MVCEHELLYFRLPLFIKKICDVALIHFMTIEMKQKKMWIQEIQSHQGLYTWHCGIVWHYRKLEECY